MESPKLQNRGLFGAWFVLTLFCYPYVYLPVAARLRQLPGSLEQSALILGDTVPQAFRRVVLRQISGSLAAGTLLVFLYTISDFGAVQLMRYDTLTRAIESNYLARPPMAFALSLILLMFAGVVVLAERSINRRLPEITTRRTSQPMTHTLGGWKTSAMTLVIGTITFAVLAPRGPHRLGERRTVANPTGRSTTHHRCFQGRGSCFQHAFIQRIDWFRSSRRSHPHRLPRWSTSRSDRALRSFSRNRHFCGTRNSHRIIASVLDFEIGLLW